MASFLESGKVEGVGGMEAAGGKGAQGGLGNTYGDGATFEDILYGKRLLAFLRVYKTLDCYECGAAVALLHKESKSVFCLDNHDCFCAGEGVKSGEPSQQLDCGEDKQASMGVKSSGTGDAGGSSSVSSSGLASGSAEGGSPLPPRASATKALIEEPVPLGLGGSKSNLEESPSDIKGLKSDDAGQAVLKTVSKEELESIDFWNGQRPEYPPLPVLNGHSSVDAKVEEEVEVPLVLQELAAAHFARVGHDGVGMDPASREPSSEIKKPAFPLNWNGISSLFPQPRIHTTVLTWPAPAPKMKWCEKEQLLQEG